MPGTPGAPGAPVSGIPIRLGTVPLTGTFVPPPQVTFPQHTLQYIGVVPSIVPSRYRTPPPSESPVFPSPPSTCDGQLLFVPPDLIPSRASVGLPSVYQPPVPREAPAHDPHLYDDAE